MEGKSKKVILKLRKAEAKLRDLKFHLERKITQGDKIRQFLYQRILLIAAAASVMLLAGCRIEVPGQEDRIIKENNIRGLEEREERQKISPEKLTVVQRYTANQQQSNEENGAKQPPAMQIDENKNYTAILKTSKGEITIELNAKATPKTVNNFVALSRDNFYNGTTFHRVIKDFMIQGGDPNGDGSGGPGYKFDDEPFEGDYKRGTVAMANSGPNTNGSQFFIIHQDYDLPKNYVIFGKVIKGMEAVDKIAEAEVTMNASMEKSKPVSPVTIESVEIVEK